MAQQGSIGVLVVDDQPAFRSAAAVLVSMSEGFHLAGDAADADRALELVATQPVALALIDVNMPGEDGLATAARMRRYDPEIVVVLVSTYDADELPADVVTSGYLYAQKSRLTPELLGELWRGHT